MTRVQLCVTPRTVTHQAPLSRRVSRRESWSGLPFPSRTVQLPGAPLPRELYHLRFQKRPYQRPVKSRRPRVCRVSGSGHLLGHHSLEKPPAPAYTSTPQEQQGPSLMPRGVLQRGLLFPSLLSLHVADTTSRETRVSPEGLGKAQQVAFLTLQGAACGAGARGSPQGTSSGSQSLQLSQASQTRLENVMRQEGAAGPRPAGSVGPSWGLWLEVRGLQRCSRSAGSAGADLRRGTGVCDGTGCGQEMNGVRDPSWRRSRKPRGGRTSGLIPGVPDVTYPPAQLQPGARKLQTQNLATSPGSL